MLKRLILVVLVLASSAAFCYADCNSGVIVNRVSSIHHGYDGSYHESYHNDVVATIAVPILVPSAVFQYLPALTQQTALAAAPVYNAATQTITQPQVSLQTAQPQSPPAKTYTEADIDKIVKEKVEEILKQQQQKQISTTPSNGPPPIVEDTKPVAKQQLTTADWVNALGNNCYECHGGGKHKGGVTLFDSTGHYIPSVSESKIAESISSGDMPKDRQITAADKQVLLTRFPVKS